MALVTASAALEVTAEILAITGFFTFRDGILDENTDTIKAISRGRWVENTTWANFNNYGSELVPIRWTSGLVDVGVPKYFTMAIETEFEGVLSFTIHVSDDGSFSGEETEYTIQEGDLDVDAFFGQYAYVTARLAGTELRRMTITTNSEHSTVKLSNVHTGQLGGTVSNRILTLPNPASQVIDMKIQPQAPTAYPVNLYVSDTPNSEVLIPMVKSKSAAAPSFVLYGIDNDPRDGIVDITLTTLPRQAMISGNLLVIA